MKIDFDGIITKDYLLRFLKGDIHPIRDRYADLPTSTDIVFDQIKLYYKRSNSNLIWYQLETSLIKLCDEKEYIFLVPLYLFSYLRFKQSNLEITMNVVKIGTQLKIEIIRHEIYLKNNKNWIGRNVNGGLLSYMYSIISLIHKEFNINLLAPE